MNEYGKNKLLFDACPLGIGLISLDIKKLSHIISIFKNGINFLGSS